MVDNDRTDALPRSGAVAGGFCGALAAVPLFSTVFLNIITHLLKTKIDNFSTFTRQIVQTIPFQFLLVYLQ
jgi:hypothetical protein